MKKSKTEKKKPAKGAGKAPAKKAAAKPVKKAAVKPVKKAAPAKKAVAKAAPKKVAAKKPAKAAVSRRHEAAKQTNQAPVKKAVKVAVKAAPKKEPKAVTKTATKAVPAKTAPAPVKKEEPKAKAPAAPVKEIKEAPAPAAKVKGEKSRKAEAAAAPAEAFPALDPAVKRPAKPFFLEVKPGVERVIKRGDKSAATQGLDIQARRKGPAAEESPEELAERIERELQSQSFLKRNRMRPQMCTKCGINAVSPRFTIDRELGYCDSCAEILRLGETKEARRMEFNLALKKEEGEEVGGEEEPSPEDVEDVPEEE